MFWAAIVGNELVGPFRVSDGVKMAAKVYMDFRKKHLVPWYKKKKLAFRKNMVFMHDNAPSHAARLTTEYLTSVFARHGKVMQWPACSPDFKSYRRYMKHPETVEGSTPPRMISGMPF